MWNLRIDHYFHGGPADASKLDSIISALADIKQQGIALMSVISDYAAKQTAWNTKLGQDLDAIAAQITALNATITAFNNSPGTLSATDQAAVDDIMAQGAALQTKADAMVASPPPVVPPVV